MSASECCSVLEDCACCRMLFAQSAIVRIRLARLGSRIGTRFGADLHRHVAPAIRSCSTLTFAVCAIGVALLAGWWLSRRKAGKRNAWALALAWRVVAVAIVSLGASYSASKLEQALHHSQPADCAPFHGPGRRRRERPVLSQFGAGCGTRKIPAKFFMESDACERCHQDIYKQWQSSAHHFSSFNNQWYRKSIEYMQDVQRTKAVEVVRRLP